MKEGRKRGRERGRVEMKHSNLFYGVFFPCFLGEREGQYGGG